MKCARKTKMIKRFGVLGSSVTLVAIVFLAGCGLSQRRKEGVQQLEQLETDVHGLHILVSAGVTKQEYSQRFEDVLLKLGDLDQSAKETVPKFPQKEQPTIKAVYTHLSQSMAAYKKARDYFGVSFEGYGCEEGCSFFRESEYETVKQQFPTLAQLSFGPEYTWYLDSNERLSTTLTVDQKCFKPSGWWLALKTIRRNSS